MPPIPPRLAALLCTLLLLGIACGGQTAEDLATDASGTGAAAPTEDGAPAGDAEPAPDPEPIELELTLAGGPAEIEAYTTLVESFESDNPDVDIVLNPLASGGDLLAALTTAFAGGQPPDMFLVNYLRYGQFAAQGVLADVQDHIDAGGGIDLADFAEPSLDAFRFDGDRLTCMPQNISSLVVYYNVDLFEAAGVDPPTAGWTWEDFLAAATTLTDAGAGQYGVGVEPSLQRLAPFIWSAGGEVVDDQADPTRLEFDDPAARVGLDFFLDLQDAGVAPPDVEEQSLEAEERFIAGQLGMYLNSRVATPTLREGVTGFTFDVGPLPTAPGGTPTTVLHGDAYCLTAAGQPEAAWRFVEHAMSVEGQQTLSATGRTVPSRIEVAESPAFLEPDEPPASSQVFLDAIPTIRALPVAATWAQMQSEVDGLLADVYYGRIDREEGIAQMIATSEAIFAQGGG